MHYFSNIDYLFWDHSAAFNEEVLGKPGGIFRAQSGKLGPNSASPQFPPPKLNYLAATSRQVRPGLDLAAGFRLGILFRPKTAARRNLVAFACHTPNIENSGL